MKTWPRRIGLTFLTMGELLGLLFKNGKWWLIPFVLVMFLLAVLLGVTQAIEYAAPFVYTLF